MAKKRSGYKHDDDNIPYMTDNMKRALDKGKDLPIEQLVSDTGMAQLEAVKARRAAPIRADQMVPISKAEAARRTTLTRDGALPLMPATRRVLPAPFQRPRIVVSSVGGHRKTWQSVRVDEVQVEDIITDLGRVVLIREIIRREDIGAVRDVATGVTVVLVGAGGNLAAFDDPHERIQVFRKEDHVGEQSAVEAESGPGTSDGD